MTFLVAAVIEGLSLASPQTRKLILLNQLMTKERYLLIAHPAQIPCRVGWN
jgi:hypothetical protein